MGNSEIEPAFECSAGSLCLDFLNTVWERIDYRSALPQPSHELLTTWDDLFSWCRESSCCKPSELAAIAHRRESVQQLKRLIERREQLFLLFRSIILSGKPSSKELALFNTAICEIPPRTLTWDRGRPILEETDEPSSAWILRRIMRDAQRLLLTLPNERLRFCDGDDCGWIFLDTSKNGKRRWCSMRSCGNREKVQRFFAKRRGSSVRRSS